eukprot:10676452-Karenia_brevis.AAC.1
MECPAKAMAAVMEFPGGVSVNEPAPHGWMLAQVMHRKGASQLYPRARTQGSLRTAHHYTGLF